MKTTFLIEGSNDEAYQSILRKGGGGGGALVIASSGKSRTNRLFLRL